MLSSRLMFNLIIALTLVMAALENPSMAARAGNDSPKADPRLLQMAAENPDATFLVIIQKNPKNKDLKDEDPETAVQKGGGKLRKNLQMIVSFSAEMTGREITKLAKNPKVRWISVDAPMVSTAGPGMHTYRDEFNSVAFNGSNGTKSWGGNPWVEIGESNGPASGDVEVDDEPGRCVSGYCLELEGDIASQWGAYRKVDLQGAVSVSLSFQYRRFFETSAGTIEVQVSSNGGSSWTKLAAITITSTDASHNSASYDISQFASANTRIRFISFAKADSEIHIDNVEIAFAYPSAFLSTIKANQLSLTGEGVTVAVVDSGITSHPDIQGRIIVSTNQTAEADANDNFVHGTHVAGIIGGNGSASGGTRRGIAPGASLINVKVSDSNGMSYASDFVDGLQWIYDNKAAYNIRVVNISMNSTVAESYHNSPIDAAVEILWFNGIVVVVSAGNNGTTSGPVPIFPPANDPFVITVGAAEDQGTASLADDTFPAFSAYGTTEDGFAKPDLVAPGRNVISLLASTQAQGYINHPAHRVDNYYFRMSGTSMSAPMVSGAVALLLQDEPNLTPDQVKYRLMTTANTTWPNYGAAQAGAGYVDASTAVHGTSTQSANMGIAPSQMLSSGSEPVTWGSVGWNSVGWNSVGWNSVGWNSVGWNSVGWNSVGWNSGIWDD